MDFTSSQFVRPLHAAENRFLEVLLTDFGLRRRGRGADLTVRFDRNTPAIWNRDGKYAVQRMIGPTQQKALDYQKQLDEFLLSGQGESYRFSDPDFCFRYASGGVLPVLRIGRREYYCLFYRDVFPVGWNIANGGCDSQDELQNPLFALERELREELIVFDVPRAVRYVFKWDAGKPFDRPEFAVARRFWHERFRSTDFHGLEERTVPLKWLYGPDSLTVEIGGEPPQMIDDCFLNVTAEDFGIEVDRVAKLDLGPDVTLCDGEVCAGRLINRPVGLFEVDRMEEELERGCTEFHPDRLFVGGRDRSGEEVLRIVDEECRPQWHAAAARTEFDDESYDGEPAKLRLCPVTRNVIKRHLAIEGRRRPGAPERYDVFISFGGEDVALAAQVYQFLERRGLRPFYSRESIRDPDWDRVVNNALETADLLIAVATNAENIKRPYADYEWRSFHHAILDKRKPDGKIVSLLSGCERRDLPLELLYGREVVECPPGNMEQGLQELSRFLCH